MVQGLRFRVDLICATLATSIDPSDQRVGMLGRYCSGSLLKGSH